MKKINPRNVAQLAILVAMEVVLSRFLSINIWSNKIGFAFLPVAVTAMYYTPLTTGITAAVADMIGALLFPSGPFFPGFTLTAFLGGIVYGLFLNTLWLSMMYNSPYWPLLTTARLWQCLIMVPVQFFVVLAVAKVLPRYIKLPA